MKKACEVFHSVSKHTRSAFLRLPALFISLSCPPCPFISLSLFLFLSHTSLALSHCHVSSITCVILSPSLISSPHPSDFYLISLGFGGVEVRCHGDGSHSAVCVHGCVYHRDNGCVCRSSDRAAHAGLRAWRPERKPGPGLPVPPPQAHSAWGT